MLARRILWRFGLVIPLLASAILNAQAIPAEAAVAAAIDSVHGWQYTNARVKKGLTYIVTTNDTGPDGQAGTWTVDYRNFPSVGPSGYDRSTDAKIYQGCKYEPSMPYGRLLGKIGADGKVFSIGNGGEFTADASGPLNARINDKDHCLVDNRGYIEVWTKGSDELTVEGSPTRIENAVAACSKALLGQNIAGSELLVDALQKNNKEAMRDAIVAAHDKVTQKVWNNFIKIPACFALVLDFVKGLPPRIKTAVASCAKAWLGKTDIPGSELLLDVLLQDTEEAMIDAIIATQDKVTQDAWNNFVQIPTCGFLVADLGLRPDQAGGGPAPTAPSDLTVQPDPNNHSVMLLSWSDNSTDETGFPVSTGDDYRRAPSHPGRGTVSYKWTGLQPNSRTCFRVRADNGDTFSEWEPSASPKCATTSAAGTR
jgi:hypothetical protein